MTPTVTTHFALARGSAIAKLNGVACYAGRLEDLPRDHVYTELIVSPRDVRRAHEILCLVRGYTSLEQIKELEG